MESHVYSSWRFAAASIALVLGFWQTRAQAATVNCREFFAGSQNGHAQGPSYSPGFLPVTAGQSPRDRSEMPGLLASVANEAAARFREKQGLPEVLHWAVTRRREHHHLANFPDRAMSTRVLVYPSWRLMPRTHAHEVLGGLADSNSEAGERARLMVALRPDLVRPYQTVTDVIADSGRRTRDASLFSVNFPLIDRSLGGSTVTFTRTGLEVSIVYPDGEAALVIMNESSRRASYVINVPETPRSEFAAALHAYLNASPLYQESVPLGLAVFAGLYLAAYGELMPMPRHLDIYAIALTREDFVRRYLAGSL